jgi:hypothetical protein
MKRKPPALHNIGIDLDPLALAQFECDYPVQRINGCAHEFLAEYDYQGSELIYCDPPCLKRTCTSARRYRFDDEEADTIELLAPAGTGCLGNFLATFSGEVERSIEIALGVKESNTRDLLSGGRATNTRLIRRFMSWLAWR